MKIPLTQGLFAEVDVEDFEALSAYRWCAHRSGKTWRIMRRSKGPTKSSYIIYMHRQIMGLNKGDARLVDHINGDGLDNRKANLRFADKASNGWNRGKTALNKSGHKGVSWSGDKQKWIVQFVANKKHHFVGYFVDIDLAVAAYAAKVKEIHGEFARTV